LFKPAAIEATLALNWARPELAAFIWAINREVVGFHATAQITAQP
jgi:hypothetical protein